MCEEIIKSFQYIEKSKTFQTIGIFYLIIYLIIIIGFFVTFAFTIKTIRDNSADIHRKWK